MTKGSNEKRRQKKGKKKTNAARKIQEEIDTEKHEQRQGTAIQKGLGETDQYS